MYILLMGAPGAGKGTQGNVLGEHLGIPKIATGDLLRAARAAGTELGRKAQTFMDQGQLVPDDIILGMVEAELAKPEAQRGAILDGFPRNLSQAEAVDALLAARGTQIDYVILLNVPEQELLQRLLKRADIEGRTDDDAATIHNRLQVYEQSTAPLIAYYSEQGKIHRIEATGSIEDIAARVQHTVEK